MLVSAEARANMWRFVRGTFPPDLSPDFLRLMAVPVVETIQISIAGTAMAVLIGLPLGILATSTLTWSGVLHEPGRGVAPGWFLPYAVARGVLSVFRSIPEYVWAFMFVRAVGLGPSPGSWRWASPTEACSARSIRKFWRAPTPGRSRRSRRPAPDVRLVATACAEALPAFISYTLYRWECAIRASAILGFVGAGGLGQQIELSMRMFAFAEVLTLLVCSGAGGPVDLSARVRVAASGERATPGAR